MKQSEIKEKIITELLQRVAKIRSGSIEDLLDSLESLEFYIPRTIQMYFDELPEPRIELDKNQIQVGWMVETSAGSMFWPLDEYNIACTYCKDAAEPVGICCNQSKLNQHIEAQEGETQ